MILLTSCVSFKTIGEDIDWDWDNMPVADAGPFISAQLEVKREKGKGGVDIVLRKRNMVFIPPGYITLQWVDTTGGRDRLSYFKEELYLPSDLAYTMEIMEVGDEVPIRSNFYEDSWMEWINNRMDRERLHAIYMTVTNYEKREFTLYPPKKKGFDFSKRNKIVIEF